MSGEAAGGWSEIASSAEWWHEFGEDGAVSAGGDQGRSWKDRISEA